MTQQFQLKNGLKVILFPSHKSEAVSVQVWVRTGSIYEPKGYEGVSHFIEHLVFKGTQDFQAGEVAKYIESAGGELNAYTTFDQTVFYMTMPSFERNKAYHALSQMMGAPLFDATEVDLEREVVIEEIKRGKDSLSRVASQFLFSTVCKNTPFSRPVIGYDEVIQKIPLKKIKDYFFKHYQPQNMFLVVTGDIDLKKERKSIEKYFNFLKPMRVAPKTKFKLSQRKPFAIQEQITTFEQNICYWSWPGVSPLHSDLPALEVLLHHLGQGDSSQLVQKLRLEEPLCRSIGMSMFTNEHDGLLLLSYQFETKDVEVVQDKLLECIETVKAKQLTEDQLKKSVSSLTSEQFYSLETVDGLSRTVGYFEFMKKDLAYHQRYLNQLMKVTAKDVQAVAIKYLDFSKMQIVNSLRKDEKSIKPLQKSIPKLAKQKFEILKKQSLPAKSLNVYKPTYKVYDTEKWTSENGIEVYFQKNTHTPVLSARWASLGGQRTESANEAGLGEMLSRILMTKTENKSENDISYLLDRYTSGLAPTAGKNSFGLSLDTLKFSEREMGDLFREVLNESIFEDKFLARESQILNQVFKTRGDNPVYLCQKQFLTTMFKDHPYAFDSSGDENTLKNLTADKIEKHYLNHLNNQSKMVVVGDCDISYWKDLINSLKVSTKVASKIDQIPVQKLQKDSVLFTSIKKEQSHLILGYQSKTMFDNSKYTLQLLQAILAGQGGRLFLELRDKLSLAYSVSPMKMEGIDGGYFGFYIGCSPEKVKLALQKMHEEIDKLKTELVGAEELERAKTYIIGSQVLDLQKNSSIAGSILYDVIYGQPFDETQRSIQKIKAVTSEDIQKLVQDIFSKPSVVSLAGPQNPF